MNMSCAESPARTLTLIKLKRKQAIVIDLDDLGELMQEYVIEQFPESKQILESIRFSTFLAWLQKRQ